MMQNNQLAIASVPMQSWGAIYDSQKALLTGTIFEDLDLPFFLAEERVQCNSGAAACICKGKAPAKPMPDENKPDGLSLNGTEREKEEQLLCQIYAVSFVLDDIRLYMDTHPKDKSGLELLKETVKTRKKLLKEFAAQFYPLTMDCMADIYEQNPASECYCWEKGPLPWEGACV